MGAAQPTKGKLSAVAPLVSKLKEIQTPPTERGGT